MLHSTEQFLFYALLDIFCVYLLKGYLENTEKDRIKRLIRLKPPTEFWLSSPEQVIVQWLVWVLWVIVWHPVVGYGQATEDCAGCMRFATIVLKSSQFLTLVFCSIPKFCLIICLFCPSFIPCYCLLWQSCFHFIEWEIFMLG